MDVRGGGRGCAPDDVVDCQFPDRESGAPQSREVIAVGVEAPITHRAMRAPGIEPIRRFPAFAMSVLLFYSDQLDFKDQGSKRWNVTTRATCAIGQVIGNVKQP